MKNLIGLFLLSVFLSGCAITAASGTRTAYEDKMKQIEQDYKDMKITKEEYIQLKNRASQQESAGEKSGSMSSGQRYP